MSREQVLLPYMLTGIQAWTVNLKTEFKEMASLAIRGSMSPSIQTYCNTKIRQFKASLLFNCLLQWTLCTCNTRLYTWMDWGQIIHSQSSSDRNMRIWSLCFSLTNIITIEVPQLNSCSQCRHWTIPLTDLEASTLSLEGTSTIHTKVEVGLSVVNWKQQLWTLHQAWFEDWKWVGVPRLSIFSPKCDQMRVKERSDSFHSTSEGFRV